MPNPVLPSAATSHMSAKAFMKLRDNAEDLPFETFMRLYYGSESEGSLGFFGEVDRDTWFERVGGTGDIFWYQEVSETDDHVVLRDVSRERTVTIDYTTNDLTVSYGTSEFTFDIIDFEATLFPATSPSLVYVA